MIEVRTKNGVELFISLCDDCFPNEGGYYCEVYLDDSMFEEFDNFVIHKEDLDCVVNKDEFIYFCCENYAKSVDDMSILNKKFNIIYEELSDVTNKLLNFYAEHILFNKNVKASEKTFFAEMLDMVGNAQDRSHEIAEHYTWD